jgi:hypothetical protein
MATKNFQIVMDEHAHQIIKKRAKMVGLNIGVWIENLQASLELRLAAAYKSAKIRSEDITPEIDERAIELILTGDSEGWDQERLRIEIGDLCTEILLDRADKMMWKPKIKLQKDEG